MKILVVGGGIAGLYATLDATLRRAKCTLVEKGRVGSGTSSKATGMLHSGARYLVSDPTVAELCWQENPKFKKNAPFGTGKQPGLFLILPSSTETYLKMFEKNAAKMGLPLKKVETDQALALEPNLSEQIKGAYLTPDVAFRPALVIEALKRHLLKRQATVLEETTILSGKRKNGRWLVSLKDKNGVTYQVEYDVIINATGSWSAEVIKNFGGSLELVFAHGAVAVFNKNLINHVVSIANKSVPGDVLIPGSNTFNVGATWQVLKTSTPGPVTDQDIEELLAGARQVLPNLKRGDLLTSFKGVRTHLGYQSSAEEKFGISRNYMIVDHSILNGLPDLYTVLAGKFVLGRLVAEKLVDKIFKKNKFVPGKTGEYSLA